MPRRVAITGAAGQLGLQLVRAFAEAGDEVLPLVRPDFDITDHAALARLTAWRPDVVVNSAAWTDVDGCARDPQRAMRINGEAAGAVAEAAGQAGALIVQISTNEVFDGESDRPYTEEDEPNPINPYGASKLEGERRVAAANPRHLIVRTAWLYSDTGGFPVKIRRAADACLTADRELRVVRDEWGNPTSAAWLADAAEELAGLAFGDGLRGICHAAGQPPCTRLDWARHVLRGHRVRIVPIMLGEFLRDSTAPARAVLDTSRLEVLGIAPHRWRLEASGATAR